MEMKVLIADSDSQLSEVYRVFLLNAGYIADTAADGLTCLDAIRTKRPHALFIDLDLMWGGGVGVLSRMRDVTDVPLVPLILVTGTESPERLSERADVPLSCCYRKPVSPVKLIRRLVDADDELRSRRESGSLDMFNLPKHDEYSDGGSGQKRLQQSEIRLPYSKFNVALLRAAVAEELCKPDSDEFGSVSRLLILCGLADAYEADGTKFDSATSALLDQGWAVIRKVFCNADCSRSSH